MCAIFPYVCGLIATAILGWMVVLAIQGNKFAIAYLVISVAITIWFVWLCYKTDCIEK